MTNLIGKRASGQHGDKGKRVEGEIALILSKPSGAPRIWILDDGPCGVLYEIKPSTLVVLPRDHAGPLR